MEKFATTVLVIAVSLALAASAGPAEVMLGPDLKIPPHYTQTIYIKKGPTAEECKASRGPYGNEK